MYNKNVQMYQNSFTTIGLEILILCKQNEKSASFQDKYVYLRHKIEKYDLRVFLEKTDIVSCKLLTKQATYQPLSQSFSFFVGAIRNYHLFRCQ